LLLELDGRGPRLVTSALVRDQTHAVLRRKFVRHATAVERFDSLWACAVCVPDVEEPADDADDADDADARLVAAAKVAGAQVFVTGDQRVLGWNPAGALHIVSLRQAWAMLVMPGLPLP